MLLERINLLFNCCKRKQEKKAKQEASNTVNVIDALTGYTGPAIRSYLGINSALSQSCTLVKFELDLSNKKDLDYNKIIKILEKYPNIKHLNLSNTNVNNNVLAALAKCNQLETLNLSRCSGVTDVSGLGDFKSLNKLDLSNTNVDDKALNKLANSESLKNSLHTLDLRGCQRVTDVSALGGCTSLQELYLVNCFQVTDVSALSRCANLQELNLGGCNRVTDVSALAGCANLQKLKLGGCNQVTDVSALAGCASLHTLDLSYCDKVTDVSALARCQSLHTLDLRGSFQVTDVSALSHLTIRQ